MAKRKAEMVTFKVDEALLEAMKGIPNRSEFIRSAILAALGSVCPLCRGTGILTPHQQTHWQTFEKTHRVETCASCHEQRVVCILDDGDACGDGAA